MESFFFIKFELKSGGQLPLLGPYRDLKQAIEILNEYGPILVKAYLVGPNGLFIPNVIEIKYQATIEEYAVTPSGWLLLDQKVKEEF